MFALFDNCLFCGAPLPKKRTGNGEHIIPKSIMGFWKSHDVCQECILYFGSNVDSLASKHPDFIIALETLGISNASGLLDQIEWKGTDTVDNKEVPMVRRDNQFRVKVKKEDDFIECSEDKLDAIAKPWLWNKVKGSLTKEDFLAEYARLLSEYTRITAGDTCHSEIFGFTLRKKSIHGVSLVHPKPSDFTRLLAKIAYTTLRYSVAPNVITEIEELASLRDHARKSDPLPPFTINNLRPANGSKPEPFHVISLYPDRGVSMLDIQLFGHFAWRVVLHAPGQLVVKNSVGQELEVIRHVLDFRDLARREKYVGMKPFGVDSFEWSTLG